MAENVLRDFLMERRREGRQAGLEEGKGAMISSCKEFGISYEETAAKVKEKFSLEDEEVEKSMQLYW